MKHRLAAGVLLLGNSFPASIAAAETAVAPVSTATSQVMSLVVSTAAVVALIVAAAWLLKRMSRRPYVATSTLRIVAGAAVGQRERVVVVEIGGTWLVLGVAPGQVNALHQMPRAEPHAAAETSAPPPHRFAQWLAQFKKIQ